MTRKERVYLQLKEFCEDYSLDTIKEELVIGFSSSDIAEKLNIQRNAASEDLNKLFRENKVIKFKGKPVLFFDKRKLEKLLNMEIRYINGGIEIDNINQLLNINNYTTFDFSQKEDEFHKLIGYDYSLLPQVEQAKAALLYPGGLHTLITGPSGVGKTYFAELMYNYAINKKVIKKDKPFVVFNCAEYADNPQLLISQLFGHMKGAFTGADEEKDGIVEKANGGILFLDEIHRLPEEGQEMLFYLIDKGVYRKMGETKGERRADIRIIGATTKEPEHVFLKTFLRRIPIIIRIPSLEERPIEDKYLLIKKFFSDEAERIGRKIVIKKETIISLLMTNFEGNIGQLKGDIQFMCARSFIKAIQNDCDYLVVNNTILPKEIRYNEEIPFDEINISLEILNINEDLIVSPIKFNSYRDIQPHKGYNIYDNLERKYNDLIKSGYSREVALDTVTDMIEKYFDNLLERFEDLSSTEINLNRIVPINILEVTTSFLAYAEEELMTKFGNDILLSLCLHVKSFVERSRNGKPIKNPDIANVREKHPIEYRLSKEFVKEISIKMEIPYSEDEVGFIAMFLYAAGKNNKYISNSKTVLILLSHGIGTATSIAKLVNHLMGEMIIEGIDMPMNMSSEELLEEILVLLERYQKINSILLMVDMGSLADLAEKIWLHLDKNVEVGVVSGINTLMLLDVSRKVLYSNTPMESIIRELNYEDYMKTKYFPMEINQNYKKIITTCITGIGTAEKIKKMLEDIMLEDVREKISIQAVDYNTLKKDRDNISKVMCIVGTFNPEIPNIPFISLEQLLKEEGLHALNNILIDNNIEPLNNTCLKSNIIKSLSMDVVVGYLTFLNPEKAIDMCTKVLYNIEKILNMEFEHSKSLRFIIHTACMIERIILNRGILKHHNMENNGISKKRI